MCTVFTENPAPAIGWGSRTFLSLAWSTELRTERAQAGLVTAQREEATPGLIKPLQGALSSVALRSSKLF